MVYIYDGSSTASAQLAMLRGSSLPAAQSATSASMAVIALDVKVI